MKSVSQIASELREAGATAEVIIAALAILDDATSELRSEIDSLRNVEKERRTKRAAQKRAERAATLELDLGQPDESSEKADCTAQDVVQMSRDIAATVAATPPSPRPPKRYNQTPFSPPSVSLVEARAREWFSKQFYPDWPNKVGRALAERAAINLYRRRQGDMTEVIAGRDRYIANKPDDRPWLNPATFLNQERFDDQPAPDNRPRAGPNKAPRRNAFFALSLDKEDDSSCFELDSD